MSTELLIVISALLTSILSGVFGMGGGMILMGVLAVSLDPAAAIVAHGVIQFVANGWRCFGLRTQVVVKPLAPFLAGSFVAAVLMGFFSVTSNAGAILILLGSTPFIGLALERMWVLDAMRRSHALAVGALTSGFQLLAGASGPLLDQLFLHGSLAKEQVVATKAAVQTVGHAIKVGYYLLLVTGPITEDAVILGLIAMPAAMMGTSLGQRILRRMNEKTFRTGSRALVFLIGSALIWRGCLLVAS